MELVIFVAGVVFGVVADRLWSRLERRPQFKLTFGIFDNIRREEGFVYTVKNVGAQDIPRRRPGP